MASNRHAQSEVVTFLHTNPLGVLATVGPKGEPQAATVAFSENAELELIIGTANTSRKNINIGRDERVAFTVTDPESRFTVQYEGVAEVLSAGDFARYEASHFAKLPMSLPFKDIPGQVYLRVRPKLVRYTDCNPTPWMTTIFTF